MKISTIIVSVLAGIIALTVFGGSWYTVDQGERAVITRNGAVVGVAEPGLGFKMPIIDSTKSISVQTHIVRFKDMATYSKDQQPANISLSVNYRVPVDQVSTVYSQYGTLEGLQERIITPRIYEELKNVFGQYNAVTAIQDRSKLNTDVRLAISNSVKGPVIIEGVQIENIDFSKVYEQSIEQRMLAEVEVQKLRQNAEREKVQAQIVVIQAQAKADAIRANAQAEADAIKLRGNAEAEAINARGKALGDNPHLVTLVQAEKWNGVLPITMVPGSSVPFINVGK